MAAVAVPRSHSVGGGLRTSVNTKEQQQQYDYQQQQTAAAQKEAPKPKTDKGKLTELHGEPPLIIQRNENGFLNRGRMLGEGGFARVYAATDSLNGICKAVKVISKEQLKSSKTKAKLFAEIKLHQVMDHPNIIKFECCFEDSEHVYMQLELCANGSMLDVLRKRKRFTEPETRYYITQLIGAAQYMHSASVIHRDLKLGNLMLDKDMNLKVGDFGLAALVKFPGERKKTICGTPNYIAPEILFDQNIGHSFEADIWSIGVIIYTMLVGKPPFQTKDVKAIYKKIKSLEYSFPSNVDVSESAVELIQEILDREPQNRPSANEILTHPFQYEGAFPKAIPPSAVDTAPDFSYLSSSQSSRNYLYVQRVSGASLASAATVSTPTIPEEDQFVSASASPSVSQQQHSMPEPPAQVVAFSSASGTNVIAQEIALDKEVKKVLEPGSPISELLKSARKPLMVSPRHSGASGSGNGSGSGVQTQLQREREKNEIARRAVSGHQAANARTQQQAQSEKENMPTTEGVRRSARHQDKKESAKEAEAGETGLENAIKALRVTSGNPTSPNRLTSSTSAKDLKRKGTSTITVAKESDDRIVHSAREAYHACWQTLQDTLVGGMSVEEPDVVTPPKVFITAWIDYTHKYGTAYQLTDGSAGVYFNDSTTMIMAPGRQSFDYISSRKGNVYNRKNHPIQSFPKDLDRKVYLMTYFEEYMTKTLERDVEWTFSDQTRVKNMDFLVRYYRMKNAIVFKLSNDVLQFNFFDHTKILLTEGASVVTFIGPDYKLKCYSLAKLLRRADKLGLLNNNGNTPTSSDPAKQKTIDGLVFLFGKLDYCKEVLKSLCEKKRPSGSANPTST